MTAKEKREFWKSLSKYERRFCINSMWEYRKLATDEKISAIKYAALFRRHVKVGAMIAELTDLLHTLEHSRDSACEKKNRDNAALVNFCMTARTIPILTKFFGDKI